MKNLLLLCFLLVSVSLSAQTGEIRGSVVDFWDGEAMPSANVWIELDNNLIITQTDSNGFYSLKGIPHGKYTLIIEYEGYGTERIKDIKARSWKTTYVEDVYLLDSNYCVEFIPLPTDYNFYNKIPLTKDISEGNSTVYTFDRRGNLR